MVLELLNIGYTEIVPRAIWVPASYNIIQNTNAAGVVQVVSTVIPYNQISILVEGTYFLSATVCMLSNASNSQRNVSIQLNRGGSSSWQNIATMSLTNTANDLGGMKSNLASIAYRLFPSDQVRVLYYQTNNLAEISMSGQNIIATGRHYPRFSLSRIAI